MLVGETDYTGVPLRDICADLDDWLENTNSTIKALRVLRERVDNNASSIEYPDEVQRFMEICEDRLSKFSGDLKRLKRELPQGVASRHIETIQQIYSSAVSQDRRITRFRDDHVFRPTQPEEVQRVLEETYITLREQFLDYRDLSNVAARLRTYTESVQETSEAFPYFHLKPNLFGFGLDLNRIIRRVGRLWPTRK